MKIFIYIDVLPAWFYQICCNYYRVSSNPPHYASIRLTATLAMCASCTSLVSLGTLALKQPDLIFPLFRPLYLRKKSMHATDIIQPFIKHCSSESSNICLFYIQYVNSSVSTFSETCSDGKQNQDETGVDCGGGCTTPCGKTKYFLKGNSALK